MMRDSVTWLLRDGALVLARTVREGEVSAGRLLWSTGKYLQLIACQQGRSPCFLAAWLISANQHL